jgi:hypothetical protein
MINSANGAETFFCPDDNETPVQRKDRADQYPKNFALLRMAEKLKN